MKKFTLFCSVIIISLVLLSTNVWGMTFGWSGGRTKRALDQERRARIAVDSALKQEIDHLEAAPGPPGPATGLS